MAEVRRDGDHRIGDLLAQVRLGVPLQLLQEPGTGPVFYVLPQGEAWFANSSIDLWLRTLHHYGLHVGVSETLSDPDDREDEALAELSMLADELKKIDSRAFDGYNGFIWAEFLDRRLW
ncbi:SUKH-4 family immunity protein [Streptomyces graminofaciens]|uniref:SUKH-4 family immunity protein n=1 Tax=Streptomyces graminofaciens TaxID=68212 RepID=UPI003305FD31